MRKQTCQKKQFEQIFLDNRRKLFSLVSRYLNRPQDIEDVVQETFIRSYQSDIKRQIDKPENYMFRTARNLSLKHLALSDNKITDLIEDFDQLGVLLTEDRVLREIEGAEQFSIFCEAASALPERCRRVFILKKVYGLTHDEIAARLDISVSTTNQHLAKALSRVTEYMRQHGYLKNMVKRK